MAADPQALLDDAGSNLDPARVWDVLMTNEKPGGHGERSVAVGVLDMAVWDIVAKVAGVPLWRLLADRYRAGVADARVCVYAAGGYYQPGKDVAALLDEMRGYLDLGYRHVELEIGGASLADDMIRIEAVARLVGDALQPEFGRAYGPPLASGENLLSMQDARNLIRYGGMRPDRDWLQFDCALA